MSLGSTSNWRQTFTTQITPFNFYIVFFFISYGETKVLQYLSFENNVMLCLVSWLVALFYGVSTLFESFKAELNSKQFSLV